jgi:hypothetical protein
VTIVCLSLFYVIIFCHLQLSTALIYVQIRLVRVYNAHGLLKKIVVGNARIKYQSYIFFSPLSMFHLLGEFKNHLSLFIFLNCLNTSPQNVIISDNYLPFFILYHYFLSSSTINCVNLLSDPEFKLIFTNLGKILHIMQP